MAANDRQEAGSHYQAELQHWDLIENWGIGYLEGCATKYLTRWRKKNGLQDLKKARHYVEKLKELAKDIGRKPRGDVPGGILENFQAANDIDKASMRAIYVLTGQWTDAYLDMTLDVIDTIIGDNYPDA